MTLRVLVVDDSRTVRGRLAEVLGHQEDIAVVGEAADGKTAIELCLKLRPDVVTMDMIMPVMTGLGATEYIMAHCPTPILVVSASTNRGELFKTYDALAAGAVDVLDKPRGDHSDDAWEQSFVAAVRMVARIPVITHPRGRLGLLGQSRVPSSSPTRSLSSSFAPSLGSSASPLVEPARPSLIALGASTGGPGALVDVLRELPIGPSSSFAWPVLFVLHIGELFGEAFADWLADQTRRQVSLAQDRESLDGAVGRVLMAPPGQHLVVENGLLRLTTGAERHSCRPSIDVLFESLAREHGRQTAACLLTGMGRDGAAGLLAIRRAGGVTFAQDETSSVVYGMPREAALLGAAERVLPLSEIGPALAQVMGWSTGGPP